jgi:hypothetical protein
MAHRDNRGQYLQVPFSREELDRIAKHAEKDSRSMAQWAKLKLLKNLPK